MMDGGKKLWLTAFFVGCLLCSGCSDSEENNDHEIEDVGTDAAVDTDPDASDEDINGGDAADDVSGGVDAQADAGGDTGPSEFSEWESEQGYTVTGAADDRAEVVIASDDSAFGDKPGGGAPILWDFGDEVFVRGEADGFNAQLSDGQEIEGSPLYGTESGRANPIYERSGEWLRTDHSQGHYYAVGENPSGAKSGAYFMGVEATGGKTSDPEPFRDGRYYYSFRQIYPFGEDDNSLKTMRGSQRDSQQEGWGGSAAGNINKNNWRYREDNTLIWPPPRDNGYAVPAWSGRPSGDVTQWHLQEMLIDPTGESLEDKIYNVWYLWFSDTGRQEWLPAMESDPDDNEVGRWAPNEYWDDSRGFYHQVGPEPAGYVQPDYYFGEIYVDDSWKRLYLTDSPSWEEAQRVELQRPVSWEDDEIVFAVNRGAFSPEDELYLYWVDNSNQAHRAGWTDTAAQ